MTGAARGHRSLEHLEDVLGRLHPFGAGVVVRPEEAERKVRLGGEDEDEQGGGEAQVATEQTKADGHRHERHGEGGQQLEDQRREERHPQGGHGGRAVAVRDVADRGHLGLGPAEDLEGREAGHHVEEVAGQALEQTGLASHPNLRRGAHQRHEQRDQRHRHRDDHRRDPVGPQHHDDDGDRDDDGQEQLREIPGEVAVQGVDAAGRQHHQAAGAFPVDAGRPEMHDPLHQGCPQVRLGRCRGPLGRTFSEPGDQRATEDDQASSSTERADVRQALMVDDDIGDGVGDEPRLGQHQPGGHATENNGQHQVAASPAGVVQEAGVDRTGTAWRGERWFRRSV